MFIEATVVTLFESDFEGETIVDIIDTLQCVVDRHGAHSYLRIAQGSDGSRVFRVVVLLDETDKGIRSVHS